MKKLLILVFVTIFFSCNTNAQQKQSNFPLSKTEAEWKSELSTSEFQVLRKAGTERPFSSDLNQISQPGTFICAACENPLYRTKHKFESGTGWPSFDRPVTQKNVTYRPDRSVGYSAKEVLCSRCGGHLGHVFNDGPRETTGKRHCINGVAMNFIPDNQ